MHRVKFIPGAPKAFKPQYVNDCWRKPHFSAMQIAKMRKRVLLAGEDWPWTPPQREIRPVIAKGHKWEKVKRERQRKIEKNMAEMPARIEEYREARKQKRRMDYDLVWWVKNNF